MRIRAIFSRIDDKNYLTTPYGLKEIKPLDVLCCKGNGLFSTIIKTTTKSPITHIAIVIESWDKLFVAEAHNAKGIIMTPIERWMEINDYEIEIGRIPVNDIDEYKLYHIRANELMGWLNYPMLRMIWIFVYHWLTNKWIEVNNRTIFCSMYFNYIFFKCKLGWITPVDSYDYLHRNNFIIK